MVYIYYTLLEDDCSRQLRGLARYLPPEMHKKMQTYRFEKDACRYLLGKILLFKGLTGLGYPKEILSQIRYSEFNKPYLSEAISFNISHSGNHVICVVSDSMRVGIDIEQINVVNLADFNDFFSPNEWKCIEQSENILKTFYRFWTRKEAVLKADGRGLSIPLQEVEVMNDPVLVRENRWYLNELDLSEGYSAHIASSGRAEDRLVLNAIHL